MPTVARLAARAGGLLLGLGAVIAKPAIAQITTTYIGPNEGLWSSPANWDLGMVPDGAAFNVIIPDNRTVVFDLPDPTTINAIRVLDSVSGRRSGNIRIGDGLSLSTQSVTILGGGLFVSEGGSFMSPPLLTTGGTYPKFIAQDGGVINVPLTTYSWTAGGHLAGRCSDTLVSADGRGSLVDLSSVASINVIPGGCGGQVMSFVAANDGVVDFSAVRSISGRGQSGNFVDFRVQSGGFIDFAALDTASAGVRFDVGIPSYALPVLSQASDTTFGVRGGSTLSLPALATVSGGSILDLHPGGAIDAPLLQNVRDTRLLLTPDRILNAPPPTQFDGSDVAVFGGATYAIADTSYTNSFSTVLGCATTAFLADGEGSTLEFGTLESVTILMGGCGTSRTIKARNRGRIDLSGVTVLRSRPDGDRPVILRTSTGGQIDLSSLASTEGDIEFRPDTPSFELPALVTADRTDFYARTFNTISLPSLTTMTRSGLFIEDGATISSPNLTSFTNGSVVLNPTRFWTTGNLSEIDESSIAVLGGAQFSSVIDTAYSANGAAREIFRAQGPGSLLDLSSLNTVYGGGSGTGGGGPMTVVAADGGHVDLSGTSDLQGRSSRDTGIHLNAMTGGRITMGDAVVGPGFVDLRADGSGTELRFEGSCRAVSQVDIIITNQATLAVSGDLSYETRSAGGFSLDTGRVVMANDAGQTQHLEVAGRDLGLPGTFAGGNFSIGSLRIGAAGSPTTVRLSDAIDNGNRGSADEPEALYLPGYIGGEALRIGAGSTLVLGDVKLYVFDGTQWKDLRAEIGAAGSLPWDEGRIVLQVCPADFDADGELTVFDFLAFQNAFDAGDPIADFDGDGSLTLFDFLAFQNEFDAGCP